MGRYRSSGRRRKSYIAYGLRLLTVLALISFALVALVAWWKTRPHPVVGIWKHESNIVEVNAVFYKDGRVLAGIGNFYLIRILGT